MLIIKDIKEIDYNVVETAMRIPEILDFLLGYGLIKKEHLQSIKSFIGCRREKNRAEVAIEEPLEYQLYYSIKCNIVEKIQELIENNSLNRDFVDTEGNRFLHIAAIYNNLDAAQILINSGFYNNERNNKQETALMIAVKHLSKDNDTRLVDLILNAFKKANLNVKYNLDIRSDPNNNNNWQNPIVSNQSISREKQ
jgi:hypothetical protein